jgi:hypothetical protein
LRQNVTSGSEVTPAASIIGWMSPAAAEEGLEALLVRPLVDHQDPALGSVEAVGDKPVLLGLLHDPADALGLGGGLGLHLSGVALEGEGHDD